MEDVVVIVLNIIQNRIKNLINSLYGKRVGVYPADFGRFSNDMKALLGGLDIECIYLVNTDIRDQGYRAMSDPKMFLASIDVCIMFGIDFGVESLLFESIKTNCTVRFINVLDKSEPLNIVMGTDRYTYIDVNNVESDKVAACLNLNQDLMLKNFERNGDLEKELPLVRDEAWDLGGDAFHPFMASVFQRGMICSCCPVCGKILQSSQSFPVSNQELSCAIFHRFVCHFEYYLMVGPSITYGMYIPDGEVVILNTPAWDSSMPISEGERRYESGLDGLKLCCLYYPELIMKYTQEECRRNLQIIVGVIHSFGQILNYEMSILDRIRSRSGFPKLLKRLLVTRYDPYDYAQIFPDINVKSVLAVCEKRITAETFRTSLESNILSLCPWGYFPYSEKLATRIKRVSRTRCTLGFINRLNKFRKSHQPIIWICLRSKRRVWRSQVEGLSIVISKLAKEYPDLGVMFDGVPGWERNTVNALRERLNNERVGIWDATLLSFPEGVVCAGVADFYISPFGNGLTFTLINNKPGLVHGVRRLMGLSSEITKPIQYEQNPGCSVRATAIPNTYDDENEDYLNDGEYDINVDILLEEARRLARECCGA